MKEIWKTIKEAPKYAISDLGRVKRIKPGKGTYVGRIIKSQENPQVGYIQIKLCVNNIPKKFMVHQLVANAFIVNKENKPELNHKDGIKANNCVNNLEWVTKSENLKHAIKMGLRSPPEPKRGEDHPWSKLKNKEVWLIKKLLQSNYYKNQNHYDHNKKFNQKMIAKMFKVREYVISKINRKMAWKQINVS